MYKEPIISVIISTYNSVDWLHKTLCSYEYQIFRDFEIVIADDGSSIETKEFIEQYKKTSSKNIIHVWHEDRGFQKCTILNKALLACNADYIVMTDGDCVARDDFLQVHYEHRAPGYFLSGGHFPLTLEMSHSITTNDIITQRCFDLSWLKERGLNSSFKNVKLTDSTSLAALMNCVTPTKPTWNGGNASAWKDDMLAVNGFDERMQYGGEDREFGERLINLGLKPKRIRYFAIVIHLEHERGYVNQEAWQRNNAIREQTKAQRKIKTDFGLNLHENEQNLLNGL